VVRMWGTVGERLIELRAEPADDGTGLQIVGLPPPGARSTADRVRAALVNSSVVSEVPAVVVRLDPPLSNAPKGDLDLTIALACLVHCGRIGPGLRWIHARGRLGLDGKVHEESLTDLPDLAGIVARLCQTPQLRYEHMFDRLEP
jgi:predicted ATPase with chaperone activity